MRTRGGDWADQALNGWDALLDDFRQWRSEGDTDAMEAHWGRTADLLAAQEGLRLSPTDLEGRERLLWALNITALSLSHDARARLKGRLVPVPPPPPKPVLTAFEAEPEVPGESFEAIVERLSNSARKPISATTKESARTALRLFRETYGIPAPEGITRAMVADWLDLLAQRPAKLPKEHRAIPLPDLVELYRDKPDVPRLSAKTLTQHVSALGARWVQAGRNGRLDRDKPNPFKEHDLERPQARAQPLGFSVGELEAIFSLPIFTKGERPRGGKGEASYWMPLLLLYTGARPEEIAQLLVTDLFHDADEGRWVLRITDEGEHPHKGRQSLKTSKIGEGRRTFPVPAPLLKLGLLRYREALEAAGEAALFPRLRPKGARNLLGSGFAQWWGEHLEASGVELKGENRQPLREFRNTWSTAARRSGIPRKSMAYIQGHAVKDATSGEGYGALSPLRLAIDRLEFRGADSSAILPGAKG